MVKNKARHTSTNSQPRAQDERARDGEATDGEGADEEEGGFRVSVDLSAWWGAGAACLVWVRAGCGRRGGRVRGLARRLRRAARLRRAFCLLAAGAALPPDAPLRILHPDDHLRVVPVEHEWQIPFSFCEDDDATEPAELRIGDVPRGAVSPPRPASPASPAAASLCRGESALGPAATGPTPAAGRGSRGAAPDPAEPEAESTAARRIPSGDGDREDAALQSVKRRALALLQRVEAAGGLAAGAGAGAGAGADEADGAPDDEGDGAPARKRRRRVRRRRPRGPPESPEPPAAPARDPDPDLDALAPAKEIAAAHHTYQTPEPAPPPAPAPAVRRNEAPPRAPRLVRALPPAARAPPPHHTRPPSTSIDTHSPDVFYIPELTTTTQINI